jgi:hypothetical protein
MDQVWERIEAWLAANAPAVAAGLNPPASARELADTEFVASDRYLVLCRRRELRSAETQRRHESI